MIEIKEATGYDTLYLVEDNVPPHQTMQRVDRDRQAELEIKTLDWPSNLPDLNTIEACWDSPNDEISTFHYIGASVATVEEAKVKPHTSTVCT